MESPALSALFLNTRTRLLGVYQEWPPGSALRDAATQCFTRLNKITPQQWEGEAQLLHVPTHTGATRLVPYGRAGGSEGVTAVTFMTHPAKPMLPADALR